VGERMWGSGYFDEVKPRIAVATKRKDWLEILVHEYCHLTQWVDQCKEWKKADKHDSCWYVEKWLVGEEVKNPYFHINNIRDLELENEKRAVKFIKDFGLDSIIDIEKYIKKANAYVGYHNYMKVTRRWMSSINTYKNRQLVKSMPNSFRMNHRKLSKKMHNVFVKSGV
jgi:hypothetical protein